MSKKRGFEGNLLLILTDKATDFYLDLDFQDLLFLPTQRSQRRGMRAIYTEID